MTISLQDIMSQHGPTGVASRGGSLVTDASAMRRFNWTGDRFTIYPSRIRFEPHPLVQTGERDNMLRLLSNSSFTAQVNSRILQPTTATAECDAFILAGNVLHEPMRGRPGGVDSYASSRPIPSNPPARVVGYIHSHPRSGGMRPPTPGSDWGPPAQRHLMQLMIEATCGRCWGMIQPNIAVVLGKLDGSWNPLDRNDSQWAFRITSG
jgi:hypothetical protein